MRGRGEGRKGRRGRGRGEDVAWIEILRTGYRMVGGWVYTRAVMLMGGGGGEEVMGIRKKLVACYRWGCWLFLSPRTRA